MGLGFHVEDADVAGGETGQNNLVAVVVGPFRLHALTENVHFLRSGSQPFHELGSVES